MDFLELFNELSKVAKPAASEFKVLESKTDSLVESGLDSLDILMICIFLCEIYGIPEEIGKELKPTTVQEAEDFVVQHKTKEPTSVEEAVSLVK